MTSKDYLITKLQELHKDCEFLDIKYEHKKHLNTHVIDVRPKEFFETNEFYVSSQLSLEDDFEELFPMEEIVFISDNELISIEDPVLVLNSTNLSEFDVVFDSPFLDEIFFNDMTNNGLTHLQCYPIEDYSFVGIEPNHNEIEIQIPPPKPWWSLKNKKSSNIELELFFV